MKRTLCVFLVVVLSVAVTAGCASAPAVKADPIVGLSTVDGQPSTFDPTSLQKPTLVVFWASWCVPCNKEAPHIMALRKELSGQLDVLGVNVDTESEDAAPFVAKYSIDFTSIHDPELTISDALGLEGTPSLVLYAAGGEELARGRALEELRSEVDKALGK
ncbi:MAG: hypothetical protein AUK47_00020 [Deltaproteobacteria bacterium CG2_30_63_29]|nr:MAG: hypothetical protein AUK47_00020 [Deltaproteobacteria bacterium CG2_30_63_29]